MCGGDEEVDLFFEDWLSDEGVEGVWAELFFAVGFVVCAGGGEHGVAGVGGVLVFFVDAHYDLFFSPRYSSAALRTLRMSVSGMPLV